MALINKKKLPRLRSSFNFPFFGLRPEKLLGSNELYSSVLLLVGI